MTNTIARALQHFCYACEETTKGTVVLPTVLTQKIMTAGFAEINQQPTYTDSEEINNSLDLLERFQDQIANGTFKIPMYVHPSGTAGTAPMGAILFESLFGNATNDSGVKETYDQTTTKKSFTLWSKLGHTVFFGSGAVAENGKFSMVNKGANQVDISGGFMQMGWAGTDQSNGATANGDGAAYVVDKVAGYVEGDTVITLKTGTGTVLEGDVVNFEDDSTDYFIADGGGVAEAGDITLRAPGLTANLADGKTLTIDGSSLVTVDEGKKFTADALISIAADHNTNMGYQIASVSTNKVYLKEKVTCADDAAITGWLPVLVAPGAPIENKDLTITFDGSAKILKSLTIDYSSPVAWQNEEITSDGYVGAYVEDRRDIKVSAEALFREAELSLFYDALNNAKIAIIAIVGTTAGKIMTINLPYTELEMPGPQPSKPVVNLSLSGKALGSSGEDSCSIVFT